VPPVTLSPPATAPRRGLTDAEVLARRDADGPNELPRPKPPSPLRRLGAQLVHFFALLLWVAAALAVVAGMTQLAVAIVAVVVVNGVFAFVQEHRAERAAERLADLLPRQSTVRRDGEVRVVDARDLVAGDVVLLDAGARVGADLALAEVADLAVDTSILTGESSPERPAAGDVAFAGTFVVGGEATGVVVATGARTRVGGLAALTRAGRRPRTPIAVELDRVVRAVAAVAVCVGVAFFGAGLLLGMAATDGFLFAVGVTVALVPEGLLPTVTLSLAIGAQRMARRHAVVRRLEAVETLGSTTFVCTDKTGTLTRNEMAVVAAWTPWGDATVTGEGYAPDGEVTTDARDAVRALAQSAFSASTGRAIQDGGEWAARGDPMEAALDAFARRCGIPPGEPEVAARYPFDSRRRRMSVVAGGSLHVKGAVDTVLPRCRDAYDAERAAHAYAERGLRVLAVARGAVPVAGATADDAERHLKLLGLVALEDPPRASVHEAVAACRDAGIRLAMVTGDHPATATAIARETGLAPATGGVVVTGAELPAGEAALGALLDVDGIVVARVTPEDKLRIARALHARGHVVAMTGDGVNDGPALRAADIGIAMGRSGTDVAREAADLVLLDDDFATIVAAVEQGRATFSNVRRFLTYHLTDNVAELAPFVAWALTGGAFPLALGVLQILALDIGTDLLPALSLGAEPATSAAMAKPPARRHLIDRRVLGRVFGVLGPAEAAVELAAFAAVLWAGGWRFGDVPAPALLAAASGTAFAAVVLGQLANAYACRSATRPAHRLGWTRNRLLTAAVAVELALLAAFVGLPVLARALDHAAPTALGWALAACAVPAVLAADTLHKRLRHRRRPTGATTGGTARRGRSSAPTAGRDPA